MIIQKQNLLFLNNIVNNRNFLLQNFCGLLKSPGLENNLKIMHFYL